MSNQASSSSSTPLPPTQQVTAVIDWAGVKFCAETIDIEVSKKGFIFQTDKLDDDELKEEILVYLLDPSEEETNHFDKLVALSYCPQLAKFKFIDYENGRVAFEGSITNLEVLVSEQFGLFFVSFDEGITFSYTDRMVNIIVELLRVYELLQKHGILLLFGSLPQNIIFLKGDTEYVFPRVVNGYHDEFGNDGKVNNFKRLKMLLNTLLRQGMPGGTYSVEVKGFLTSLDIADPSFAYSVNHPGLWQLRSLQTYAIEAISWCKANGIKTTYLTNSRNYLPPNDYGNWKSKVVKDVDLQIFANGKKNKFPTYSLDIYGLLEFTRNTFVHYKEYLTLTDAKGNAIVTKILSLQEIETRLGKIFPNFKSDIYRTLRLKGFNFVEKYSRVVH